MKCLAPYCLLCRSNFIACLHLAARDILINILISVTREYGRGCDIRISKKYLQLSISPSFLLNSLIYLLLKFTHRVKCHCKITKLSRCAHYKLQIVIVQSRSCVSFRVEEGRFFQCAYKHPQIKHLVACLDSGKSISANKKLL